MPATTNVPSGLHHDVILLPGAVLPADLAYAALLETLGDSVEPAAKELELYAADAPPPDYTLGVELDGILRTAAAAGFDRFHLVGYSAGGASSLAFAARHPERLRSLALIEPAWAGNDGLDPAEAAVRREHDRIMALPPGEMMAAFVRANLRPGIEPPPPPPGPTPPWMAKRPAGLKALTDAFRTGALDLDALRRFRHPVYFALGGLSNPDYYLKMAERLAGVFPDFTLEVFEQRHHFDPPHRIEPERLATSLRDLWARAEAASPAARIIARCLPELEERWRPTVERLTELVFDVLPDGEHARKWGRLTFTRAGDWHHWICAIAPSRDAVKLVIHKGALLADPRGVLEGQGRYSRSIPFRSPEEIDADIVEPIVREAAARQTEM